MVGTICEYLAWQPETRYSVWTMLYASLDLMDRNIGPESGGHIILENVKGNISSISLRSDALR